MKRTVNEIILHCSANDCTSRYQISVNDIYNYHTKTLHWKGIGYHYIVDWQGKVWQTRKENIAGAHCYGHNATSIGICYLGGMQAKQPFNSLTLHEEQRNSYFKLVMSLAWKYDIPLEHIKLHNEYENKACPSFDRKFLEEEIEKRTAKREIINYQHANIWLNDNVNVYIPNKHN